MEWELVPDPDHPDDWYRDECWDRWEAEQQEASATRVSEALSYLLAAAEKDFDGPDDPHGSNDRTQSSDIEPVRLHSTAPVPDASRTELVAHDGNRMESTGIAAPPLERSSLPVVSEEHDGDTSDNSNIAIRQIEPSSLTNDLQDTKIASPLVPLVESRRVDTVQVQAASTINDDARRKKVEHDRQHIVRRIGQRE